MSECSRNCRRSPVSQSQHLHPDGYLIICRARSREVVGIMKSSLLPSIGHDLARWLREKWMPRNKVWEKG
jgi:hypothetical protein